MVGGFVDSIAGDGGLLTLPVLLAVLPSPAQTIATLKTQSLFGTLATAIHFTRQGLVQPRTKIVGMISALAGGVAGAVAVQLISPALLMTIVPILLIAIATDVACSQGASDIELQQRLSPLWFGILVIPAIAFYGGLFGPGTGAFFMVALVALRGYGLLKAIANAKLLDCAAHAGAVLMFLAEGQIVWSVAIVMSIGHALGARWGNLRHPPRCRAGSSGARRRRAGDHVQARIRRSRKLGASVGGVRHSGYRRIAAASAEMAHGAERRRRDQVCKPDD